MEKLTVTSSTFLNNEYMQKKHTGFGDDISPAFHLHSLSDKAVSVAIIMDDLDIAFIKELNHWLIWNIPKTNFIPENIPYGSSVSSLENAIQGVAYGVNRYRGPKQPIFIRSTHRYKFKFYVLDCYLDLGCTARKKDLVAAMQGHIIQQASITGKYKR